MNNENKSRTDMIIEAMTIGYEEAEKMGLSKDYRNWTPLLLHCYQTGVFGGVLGTLIGIALSVAFNLVVGNIKIVLP